jgi:DNA polymerase-3 subunit epsilon
MGFLDRFMRTADTADAVPLPVTTVGGLPALVGGADRIAVVDCETTGVYNSDRVVEIAVVTLDLEGRVIDTWATLIQPQRDVGASHIHGLTAESLRDAPTFDDVAGDVALRLHGACLAAHNLPFDRRMLVNEYERLGADLAVLSGLDTLTATRCRLAVACEEHRVPLADAHSALADAMATASLLARVLGGCGSGSPAAAPVGLTRSGRVLRRSDVAAVVIPDPPHIAQLAHALNHPGLEANILAYLDVVGRAVADLRIDASERAELLSWGIELGLGDAEITQAHRRYVSDLVDAALEDDIVTEAELDALLRVASALGVDAKVVEHRTRGVRARAATVQLSAGMTVVFTGDDPRRPRLALSERAIELGMAVGKNVTKSTDLLVVYESDTASGKATKARSYGVPIITTEQFAAADLGGQLEGSSVETKKVITCPDCHTTWTVSARTGAQSSRRCEDCRGVPASRRASTRGPAPATPPSIETLTCTVCGRAWTRDRVRGRKPLKCADCTP